MKNRILVAFRSPTGDSMGADMFAYFLRSKAADMWRSAEAIESNLSCYLLNILENHRAERVQVIPAHRAVFAELRDLGLTPWVTYPTEDSWSSFTFGHQLMTQEEADASRERWRAKLNAYQTLPDVRHLILDAKQSVSDVIRYNEQTNSLELID